MVLAKSIATPTFVILSGGGVQPWWVFEHPWTFATDVEREEAAALAQAWEQAHRDRVSWAIDSTHDLARVRRIPGMRNFKGDPPRMVEVKRPKGARRWTVDDLRAMVAGVSTPKKRPSASLNGHSEVDPHRLASLMASRAFARVWQGRQRFPSSSERDREAVRRLSSAVIPPAVRVAHETEPDDAMDNLLDDAARAATLGRTAVERESWGTRDITNVPQPEEPMRLARQLGLLARGLIGLGLPRTDIERFTVKAALDSMPEARRRVLAVLGTGEVVSTSEVARRTGMDRKVTKRALEDLAAVGVCEVKAAPRSGEADRWALVTGEDARAIVAVTSGRAG